MRRHGPRVGLVLTLAALSCAHRIPLAPELAVADTRALVARMREHAVVKPAYSAELRVTYFGREGRLRTTGSLAVMRPSSLRYELQGPHGGVVEAFATNGVELQLLDARSSRFVYGPARPENLDAVLSFAPLSLEATQWVGLFFGEVEPPEDAPWRYDERTGRFVVGWLRADLSLEVELEPRTARIEVLRLRRGGQLLAEVTVNGRDRDGLPEALHMKAPRADVELELALADVDFEVELEPSTFVLDAPAGAMPVRVEHFRR